MSAQLELDLPDPSPWPYTFTPPLEVRQLAPDLTIEEWLPFVRKGEHAMYSPKTGALTIVAPIAEEDADG